MCRECVPLVMREGIIEELKALVPVRSKREAKGMIMIMLQFKVDDGANNSYNKPSGGGR